MPNATVANITLCLHDSEISFCLSVASEIEQKACFEEFPLAMGDLGTRL